MRAKKWLTISTVICTIGSIALIIFFKNIDIRIGYDISLAIFGSALLGFIMSLIEYFSERKSSMEEFWSETMRVLAQFRQAKPIVLSEPEELVLNSLFEDESNKMKKSYGEKLSESLGLKEENVAKEAYIAWLESHDPMSLTKNDNITELFDEVYEYHLGQDKTQICY